MDEEIYANLKETVLAMRRLGRDAKALQAEMLEFPGFVSLEGLKASLLHG